VRGIRRVVFKFCFGRPPVWSETAIGPELGASWCGRISPVEAPHVVQRVQWGGGGITPAVTDHATGSVERRFAFGLCDRGMGHGLIREPPWLTSPLGEPAAGLW
jgi:hypothetical protein